MAIGDAYCSPSELKSWASVNDTTDDVILDRVAKATSRQIERFCGRQFNDAGSATARLFRPHSSGVVEVADFHTTTGLVVQTDDGDDGVYETTISSSNFTLYPLDGVVDGQTGWPYREIRLHSSDSFPTWSRSYRPTVQVTARWGWASVPSDVKQAALIQATRIFGRRYSHTGVVGLGQGDFVFGVSRQLDPDVRELLAPYQLPVIA